MLSFFCLISFHLFFKYFHLKGELGYPIGIILDKGQALTSDDLSNPLMFTTVKISLASIAESLSRCR